ncbi:MAG: cobalt-precorrin-5B (C(1))-methyltransferase, partial [Desulfoplanes sp.]
YEEEKDGVRVTVIKDGGDDPDVTHETPIQCVVSLQKDVPVTQVCILGGRGVGRVSFLPRGVRIVTCVGDSPVRRWSNPAWAAAVAELPVVYPYLSSLVMRIFLLHRP